MFYKEMWDKADKTFIPHIFHQDFNFRGSLGPVLVGHDQFAGYVDMVTTALDAYTSDILDLVEEGNTVCGVVRFHGVHRAPLLGHPGTGRHVSSRGAPVFKFDGVMVRDLWVLGDLHGLIRQLASGPADQA